MRVRILITDTKYVILYNETFFISISYQKLNINLTLFLRHIQHMIFAVLKCNISTFQYFSFTTLPYRFLSLETLKWKKTVLIFLFTHTYHPSRTAQIIIIRHCWEKIWWFFSTHSSRFIVSISNSVVLSSR